MNSPEHEKRAIIQYWEIESPDKESVLRAEKIHVEILTNEQRYDVWEVSATDGDWWVITNMTNLYPKSDFPSMDHALNQHIGLIQRVRAKEARRSHSSEEELTRLAIPFRRIQQASEALNAANEAEEFQAVGMQCRECLLALIREIVTEAMIPVDESSPKQGDFLRWSDIVASNIASGESSRKIRAYLKSIAGRTWELVSWLTHASNARLFDGEMAVEATGHLITVYAYALVRHERGEPDQCPRCSSYRLTSDFRAELAETGQYVTLCETCGWEDVSER